MTDFSVKLRTYFNFFEKNTVDLGKQFYEQHLADLIKLNLKLYANTNEWGQKCLTPEFPQIVKLREGNDLFLLVNGLELFGVVTIETDLEFDMLVLCVHENGTCLP